MSEGGEGLNYIGEINAFERWLEQHPLELAPQLLMYKFYKLANRAGWPEWVLADNLTLIVEMKTKREATVIAWRDKLIDSKLLEYKKGRKGVPNRYKITSLYTCTTLRAAEPAAEPAAESAVQAAALPVVKTADIYKPKPKPKKDILTDIQKEPEWDDFVKMRREIKKPLTTGRAVKMALDKLEKLAPGDIEMQKKILSESIYHCWQGLFPLKGEGAVGGEKEPCKGGSFTNNSYDLDELEAMIVSGKYMK